jgi:hypothetical protein
MQGFPQSGVPGPGPASDGLAQLQATMHAIEVACHSIQVPQSLSLTLVFSVCLFGFSENEMKENEIKNTHIHTHTHTHNKRPQYLLLY